MPQTHVCIDLCEATKELYNIFNWLFLDESFGETGIHAYLRKLVDWTQETPHAVRHPKDPRKTHTTDLWTMPGYALLSQDIGQHHVDPQNAPQASNGCQQPLFSSMVIRGMRRKRK
eukprot:m.185798 g.185798  ORF g.185798 m.185798 type:complete len:116 (-) comp15582_c0_seq7:190-537(-)